MPRSVVSSSRWGSIMKRDVEAVYTGYYIADGYILGPDQIKPPPPDGSADSDVTARACPPNTDSQGRVLLLSRAADLKHFTTEWSAHPHGCSINPAMFSLS